MLYDDEVLVKRLVSVIAGPGEEVASMKDLLESDCGILREFAKDEDIQEMRVYQKQWLKCKEVADAGAVKKKGRVRHHQ